jgi:hypothetical protein
MGNYKEITKVLVWIVVISTVLYFVLLPVSFTRPNPQRVSPGEINKTLQANPFSISTTSENLKNNTQTTSTIEFEIPSPSFPVSE